MGIEVTDEMIDATMRYFNNSENAKQDDRDWIAGVIKISIELHEANKQHLVTKDAMTNCVHVLPMDFVKDLSNGTQNLKHLSEKERDAIVRCIANAVVESCNPTPNPVGYVKTVGGYPDESEHRAEWVVKYKELKDGQPLYTTPPTRDPLVGERMYALRKEVQKEFPSASNLLCHLIVRLTEQAYGIGTPQTTT